jgi:hypothetical protein
MSLSSDGAVMTMPVTPAYQGGNGGFGGWGGDWASWIILFLIFGMFGWGGYGGGWGGNSGNGLGSPSGQGWATRADINEGFALNNLQSGINSLQQGICNLGYDQLAQMNGINTNILNTGFGIQNAIQANTVAGMQNTNALQTQLAECCCDQRAATQDLKYTIATEDCATRNLMQSNTRDIIDSQNNGINAIMGKLAQMEYNGLNDKYQAALAENQALKFQASQASQNAFFTANQEAQTAELIRRINPMPVPAYQVPNPYAGCGCNPCGGCC